MGRENFLGESVGGCSGRIRRIRRRELGEESDGKREGRRDKLFPSTPYLGVLYHLVVSKTLLPHCISFNARETGHFGFPSSRSNV